MFPNYTLYYDNANQLVEELKVNFRGQGWYKKGQDYVFIAKEDNKLVASIWDNHDPRNKWKAALAMPIFNAGEEDVINAGY